MKSEKVTIDGLSEAVEKIIAEYGVEVQADVNDVVEDMSKDIVKKVKAESKEKFQKGKGSRHYANGWRAKVFRKRLNIECVVFNAYKPQLTHLLENGHAKANGVGWVDGKPHIAPVNKWTEEEVINRLEAKLK